MTPPQSYSDWQRWMPPSRGGVASAGGSHHCPATIPSLLWGLSDHVVLLVPGAFLTRALGSPVSSALAQFFSLEKAPVSKFGGAVEVSLQTCLWQCQEETVFPAEGLRWRALRSPAKSCRLHAEIRKPEAIFLLTCPPSVPSPFYPRDPVFVLQNRQK